ncbi:MAG: winged helix-turn-helix domain-containing protein, partial [Proteobacteria bacterium]|nr:winged helix-turn-helix domain-containing protein [Pseudomonadota bacterium]
EKGTVSGKTSEKISGKKSYDTCVKILNLILEHPDITLAELARQTGRTERAVSYNLRKLQDEGRLTRVGGRKLGYWQVNHDNG